MSDCYTPTSTTPKLKPVEEAISELVAAVDVPNETELVELSQANRRVLAQPICSTIDVPAFNNSAMDGYAIHDSNLSTNNGSPKNEFTVIGSALAGQTFDRSLQDGEAIRIMTGAPVPKGANAVVMQENTQVNDDRLTLMQPAHYHDNIRFAGEDIQVGQAVFHQGHQVRSIDIGVLASLGVAEVLVYKPLTVAIFSTGDELTLPGQNLAPGQIYDSNRITIANMLNRLGAEVIDLGVIKDDKNRISAAFQQANEQADLIISSGGVSVGDADYTKEVLAELGEIGFWKVAIKPGKPFAYGKLTNSHFMGLPGNPVSAAVTFHILALPAIVKMMGGKYQNPQRFLAQTTQRIKKRPGRMDFQRGIAHVDESGHWQVTPFTGQGSGIMTSLSNANCYLVLPQESGPIDAGQNVLIQLFDSTFAS